MKVNRELGFDEMFRMAFEMEYGPFPLKSWPNHELSRFWLISRNFTFSTKSDVFAMKMNRELGFHEMFRMAFEMEYGPFPLKSCPNHELSRFWLISRNFPFLRNLTFCHENESGTRI